MSATEVLGGGGVGRVGGEMRGAEYPLPSSLRST